MESEKRIVLDETPEAQQTPEEQADILPPLNKSYFDKRRREERIKRLRKSGGGCY